MWSVQQTWKLGRRAAGFLGGLLVALLLAAGPAAGQTWSAPMTLSNGGLAANPAVAFTSSGQIYVAWAEDGDIYFKRSLPSGGSCSGAGELKFDAPLPLSNRTKDAFGRYTVTADSPSIAANGGGVFVAWQEVPVAGIPGGVQAIRFRRSTNGGEGFNDPESLRVNQSRPTNPAVAADNTGVFVAWQEVVPGPLFMPPTTSVLVAQSLNGDPFGSGPVVSVTRNPAEEFQPSVASDGTTVHVVWQGRNTAVSSLGVWYKGYAREGGPATIGSGATLLRSVPSISALTPANPKVAVQVLVQGTQVTAAWFDGGSINARTMTNGSFDISVNPELIYSSTMTLASLSLNFGGAGRLVAWRETDSIARTRAVRYLVQGEVLPDPVRIGDRTALNVSSPALGQDGTGRLVATWHENKDGTTGTEAKLSYKGSFGGGTPMDAWVGMTPRTLNAKTMSQGEGIFTLRIRVPNVDPGAIVVGSLKITSPYYPDYPDGQSLVPVRSSVADADGDGIADTLELKFHRRDLLPVLSGAAALTAAQRDGSYTVTGNVRLPNGSLGCFSGSSAVQFTQ